MASSVVTRDQSAAGERTSGGGAIHHEIEESRKPAPPISAQIWPQVCLSFCVCVRQRTHFRPRYIRRMIDDFPAWEWVRESRAEDYECSVSSGTRDQRRRHCHSGGWVRSAGTEPSRCFTEWSGKRHGGFYPFLLEKCNVWWIARGKGDSFWLLVLSFMAGDNRYISVFNLSILGWEPWAMIDEFWFKLCSFDKSSCSLKRFTSWNELQ